MSLHSPRSLGARLLTVAVSYAVGAYLSHSLGLGPGKISPIWLPAGIALAAFLVWGYRMAPGVFLGAFIFELYSSSQLMPLEDATLRGLLLGGAAAGQAAAACWALRARTACDQSLDIHNVRDSLRFAAIVMFACTIAPTAGILSLTATQTIDPSAYGYYWITWWIGDLCGMLVLTPLLLLLRKRRRLRDDWTALTLPIIGLGLGFTLVSAFLIYHLDREARLRDFSRTGMAITNAVDRAIELTIHDLVSAQLLFYRDNADAATFHDFAESVRANNPRLNSLSWLPRTDDAALASLETAMRKEGNSDFSVFEIDAQGQRHAAAPREFHYPAIYIEPAEMRFGALGFDAASEPRRFAAMNVALITGEPTATEAITLVGDPTHQLGIRLYLPVYRNTLVGNLQHHSQEALIGFVSASVSIAELMKESMAAFDTENIDTWLIDSTGVDNYQILYGRTGTQFTNNGKKPSLTSLMRGVYYSSHFPVGGRDWMIITRPRDSVRALHAFGLVVAMLFGGGGLTLMLATYMATRQRNEEELRARDQRLLSQNAVLTLLAQRPMATAASLQDGFRELCVTAATTLKVERASIWLLEDDNTQMRCQCLFHGSTGVSDPGTVLTANEYPRYFTALLENRVIAADDAHTDARTREFRAGYLMTLGIGAMLDAPIRAGGHLVGVICHEHVGPARHWTLDEQNFAGSMGDMASLMMESASRSTAELALQEANQALEEKVARRTEQLRVANKKLREIDKLKSMFIASMSHELRTPLNSIIGFTGVVLQGISGAINERQKDQLGRVFNSARHLLSLITDVIDISKIEAGYVQVYREDFRVDELLEEALSTVQPQRTEKGLELITDIAPDLHVTSDRKRLLQCVLNLLSNAVKYTEKGGITVRLRPDADCILIEVEDTGIGISSEAQKRLFEPFERVDSHLRIRTPGTGLGLYLTRKIVTELLHGRVEAQCTPDVGCVFRIWIPPQPDNLAGTTP